MAKPDMTTYSWDQIKTNYVNGDILLGNGFSINVWSDFRYSSLFDYFISGQSSEMQEIFKKFETTNFEEILESLQNAESVNEFFHYNYTEITNSIKSLRNGLIESVKALHPEHKYVDKDKLEKISKDIYQFRNIFALSYDVILYYVIMIILNKYEKREYNTYFSDKFCQRSGDFLNFDSSCFGYNRLGKPCNKYIYYLHGALFIFRHENVYRKIIRSADIDILTMIESHMHDSSFPIFVSEGTSQGKERTISRNGYLTFAFEQFKQYSPSLVIYGATLSDSDLHIRKSVQSKFRRNKTMKLAISIFTSGKSISDIDAEKLLLQSYFSQNPIQFFDSATLF